MNTTFFSVDSEPASSVNIVISRIGFNPVIGGSNDRFEETTVLDRSELLPRWRWITWELSDCFQSRWTAAGPDKPWSQAALHQVVARNLQTQSWKATYRSLRSELFAQLLNGKIVIGNPVRVDVTSDTVIELDHVSNGV